MKRIAILILSAICSLNVCYGQTETDQPVDFKIVAQGSTDKPIYRTAVTIPVQGYYISAVKALYLSFTDNIGVINVSIENTSTGEYQSDTISSGSGMAVFTLSSTVGHVVITLTTSDGREYEGELQL